MKKKLLSFLIHPSSLRPHPCSLLSIAAAITQPDEFFN
jgi:hypothetical protein